MYDVVIVGGGPAGLSAALMLGRCRRRVLVCDNGRPRNAASLGVHGFLTRDGIPPLDLLALGRAELEPYDVEIEQTTVQRIDRLPHGFMVQLDSGQAQSAVVLLATGVRDRIPDIAGAADCFGISLHHCPYCDGWEFRDKRIAVLGSGTSPAGMALSLRTWSRAITACSHGARIKPAHRDQLQRHDVAVRTGRIARLEHKAGRVRQLMFEDGSTLHCDAVFFTGPQHQQCDLAVAMGCEFNRRGTVKTDLLGRTCVDGLFVVGDASRDMQFAIVAAAEGAKAAAAINQRLQEMSGLALKRSA